MADSAAIGDREVVAVEDQVGLGLSCVAQRDQVFVSGAHQAPVPRRNAPGGCGAAGGTAGFQSLIHSAIGLSTMSLPPPENRSTSHGTACRAAVAELLGEELALLDAQHVADLVAGFGQVQDRDAEPILEPRDDAAAEEWHRIVEPRIPLGENLQRRERPTLRCRFVPLGLGAPFARGRRAPRSFIISIVALYSRMRRASSSRRAFSSSRVRHRRPPGTPVAVRLAQARAASFGCFACAKALASASVTGPVARGNRLGTRLGSRRVLGRLSLPGVSALRFCAMPILLFAWIRRKLSGR